jgi:CheY-like chemotaxis protein
VSFLPPSRPEPRPQLLIVDDDAAVLDVTRSMARALGCHALVADNSTQALDLFRENAERIWAVLVDLNMPRVDGLALLRQLLELRPGTRVLLMTGDAVEDDQLDAIGVGRHCLLTKPFFLIDLERALFGRQNRAEAA